MDTLWPEPLVTDGRTPAVLVVDDDRDVLETLSFQLQHQYPVVTAHSGDEALAVLADGRPVAALISDMRMPGMDGIELLGRVQLSHPHITRVLHTARADVGSAIAAINNGGVYRFLCKPCPSRELRQTAHDAVDRYRRVVSERTMLDQTLRASLEALFGCLELASPAAFARAGRIRGLVTALCHALALGSLWEIEVAALASQLGAVTLPPSVLAKMDQGLPLPADEQHMVDATPDVAVRLLERVPMLEDVVEIIRGLRPDPGPRPAAEPSALVATAVEVLRVATEYDTYDSRGMATENAIAILDSRGYRPEVVAALRRITGGGGFGVRAVRIAELDVGMRIADDVVAANGLVLIGRGTTVTTTLLSRLDNFRRIGQVTGPVLIIVPPGAA